jgi:hypothetical protein
MRDHKNEEKKLNEVESKDLEQNQLELLFKVIKNK